MNHRASLNATQYSRERCLYGHDLAGHSIHGLGIALLGAQFVSPRSATNQSHVRDFAYSGRTGRLCRHAVELDVSPGHSWLYRRWRSDNGRNAPRHEAEKADDQLELRVARFLRHCADTELSYASFIYRAYSPFVARTARRNFLSAIGSAKRGIGSWTKICLLRSF